MLQASDLNNESDLKNMFKALADVMNVDLPKIDYPNLIERCNPLILNYTYYDVADRNIKVLCDIDEQLKEYFYSGVLTTGDLYSIADYKFSQIIPALENLKKFDLLTFELVGGMTIGGAKEGGITKKIKINLTQKYLEELLPRIRVNAL